VNLYELASMSAIAGCMPRVGSRRRRDFDVEADLSGNPGQDLLRLADGAGVLENTSNRRADTVLSPAQVVISATTRTRWGLKVHLMGRGFLMRRRRWEPRGRCMTRKWIR